MRVHGVAPSKARSGAVALLQRVGILHAAGRISSYPNEFLCGQRQRDLRDETGRVWC